ncbi:hypothetical protein ACJX0J_034339, partial [Zea mays]
PVYLKLIQINKIQNCAPNYELQYRWIIFETLLLPKDILNKKMQLVFLNATTQNKEQIFASIVFFMNFPEKEFHFDNEGTESMEAFNH